MRQVLSLARARLSSLSPAVEAHLRGELPQELQGPGPRSPMPQRQPISAALLDDLCEERPEDCKFWDSLRDPAARVVATGQQPGALGGPLLVLYKAATAVAEARRLSKQEGIPVLPVFWNATDDVDFDEIATVGWHEAAHGLFYLELPRGSRRPEAFVGDLPADGDLTALEAIRQRVAPQRLKAMEPFLPPNALDHGDWVGKLLRRLFPELLVLDARSPALRRHAAPLFQRYLEQHAVALKAIEAETVALEAVGHSRVLAPASTRMGLFLTEGGVRQKTDDIGILLQTARDHPEALSPNVTLRPLVQDLLLPTVAFVVGPTELGYLLELRALRQLLGVPEPALLSRLSCTMIPADVWEQLQNNAIDVQSWLRSPEEALRHRAGQLAADVVGQADATWHEFDQRLSQLRESGMNAEAIRKAQKGLHPLRKRMTRELEETQMQQLLESTPGLATAAQMVRPRQRLQERVLGGLCLLGLLGSSTAEHLVRLADAHLQALERGHDEHVMILMEEMAQSSMQPVERSVGGDT